MVKIRRIERVAHYRKRAARRMAESVSTLPRRARRNSTALEHDREKWIPVFPRDKCGTRLRGDQVISVINRIAKGFSNVVMTQDWHTPGHISFASVHAGKKPFETIDLAYGKQVLWPDHCVQGTEGAALSKDLSIPQAGLVIRKGFHKDVDSYSAFTEADGKTTTGLAAYLKARQIKRVFVAGLATDFCVAWTAIDARKAGFETYVIEDACRGIDAQGSLAKAWADMAKAGVKRIQSGDIAA